MNKSAEWITVQRFFDDPTKIIPEIIIGLEKASDYWILLYEYIDDIYDAIRKRLHDLFRERESIHESKAHNGIKAANTVHSTIMKLIIIRAN